MELKLMLAFYYSYINYLLISSYLILAAEYQLLCGNQAPGFIIDIHTGKPIGKVTTKSTLGVCTNCRVNMIPYYCRRYR